MNKKLLNAIKSIVCGLGITGAVSFIATSCQNDDGTTSLSLIEGYTYDKTLETYYGVMAFTSPNLSKKIVTNTGKMVTGVKFELLWGANDDKPDWIGFNESNGQIMCVNIPKFESDVDQHYPFTIRFSKEINSKMVYGSIDNIELTIHANGLVITSEYTKNWQTYCASNFESEQIAVEASRGGSISNIRYELVLGSTLPEGLELNPTTGKVSGIVKTNENKTFHYKIHITGQLASGIQLSAETDEITINTNTNTLTLDDSYEKYWSMKNVGSTTTIGDYICMEHQESTVSLTDVKYKFNLVKLIDYKVQNCSYTPNKNNATISTKCTFGSFAVIYNWTITAKYNGIDFGPITTDDITVLTSSTF